MKLEVFRINFILYRKIIKSDVDYRKSWGNLKITKIQNEEQNIKPLVIYKKNSKK